VRVLRKSILICTRRVSVNLGRQEFFQTAFRFCELQLKRIVSARRVKGPLQHLANPILIDEIHLAL
jgi:hypothetical protein